MGRWGCGGGVGGWVDWFGLICVTLSCSLGCWRVCAVAWLRYAYSLRPGYVIFVVGVGSFYRTQSGFSLGWFSFPSFPSSSFPRLGTVQLG